MYVLHIEDVVTFVPRRPSSFTLSMASQLDSA